MADVHTGRKDAKCWCNAEAMDWRSTDDFGLYIDQWFCYCANSCFVWLYFMREFPSVVSWGFIIACVVFQFVLMMFFGKAGLLGTRAQFSKIKAKLAEESYISEDMLPTSLPAVAEDTRMQRCTKWLLGLHVFALPSLVDYIDCSHINLAIAIMKEASKALRICRYCCPTLCLTLLP